MMVIVFNLWQLILKGGPMMWPIILLSVVALAVGMERLRYLSSIEKLFKTQKSDLMRSLQQHGVKQALILCETYQSPLGHIFKAGILKSSNSSDLMRASMDEVFIYESHRLKERMNILSFVMNVSVLIGLLGTVIGLTMVFHAVQVRANVLNPLSVGDMSVGVWQALFTTIAGLVVCILSYSIYSFCSSRINNVIADLQISMAQLVHVLVQLAELNKLSEDA